jgi:DNA-binding transcriptional regulator YiaG
MKTKITRIEVRIPNADGTGVAERVPVDVPVKWDAELKEWLLTEEAHQLIDNTKARHMGLVSPAELREMRTRLRLTQRQIGELLQVGEKSYTRWETGRSRPSRSINVLLCALRDARLSIQYLQSLQKPVVEWWSCADARTFESPVVVPFSNLEPISVEGAKQELEAA